MKKVLFIIPPDLYEDQVSEVNFTIPLGILYIASYLAKHDIPVSCIDCLADKLSLKELAERIKEFEPDIIGISYSSTQRAAAHKTAQLVKEIDSDIKVIVGGPHVTYLAEATLRYCPYVDIAVQGEGEITMLEMVNGKPLEEIGGIAFRREGKILVNPPRPPILNPDSLPFPARYLLDFMKYQDKTSSAVLPCATVITSRGCPYQCTFCSTAFTSKIFRQRSPENVVEELKTLIGNLNIKAVNFVDDNMLLSKKWVEKFCNLLIEDKIDLMWHCLARVDAQAINRETLSLMKRAGCYWISFGVESGSPQVLKRIKKGFSVEQVIEAFKLTTEAGICAKGFFMVGFPEENAEDVKKTLNLMKKLPASDFPVAVCMLFPGSEMTNNSREVDDDFWFQEFYSPFPFIESTIPIPRGERNRSALSQIASYMGAKVYYHHFFEHMKFRANIQHIKLSPIKWACFFLYFVVANFFLGDNLRLLRKNRMSLRIERFSSLLKEFENGDERL